MDQVTRFLSIFHCQLPFFTCVIPHSGHRALLSLPLKTECDANVDSVYNSYLILHEVSTVQAQTLRCILTWPFPKINISGQQSNTLNEKKLKCQLL